MKTRTSVKIFICLLCALLISSPVASAAETSAFDDATYYTNTFDDASALDGAASVAGSGGYVYVADGELCFEASDTYPPVTTVLFPFVSQTDDYVAECDITVTEMLSGGSWASLVFGAQGQDRLYQLTFRPDTQRDDSLQLMYKKGSSAWETLKSVRFPQTALQTDGAFTNGTSFHLTVAVKNGTAFGYINGTLAIETRITGTAASGRFGINGRGLDLLVDNFTVHGDLPDDVGVAETFSSNLYIPETGIIEPPAIIQRDVQSLSPYTSDAPRASVVLYSVRYSGDGLYCYDGSSRIGALSDRYAENKGLVIPAFYVSDGETASRLNAFITENAVNDAFVVSQNISQIRAATGDNKYIRGVLDISLTDTVSAGAVYATANKNGVYTVLLSQSAADGETVTELRKRMLTVWARCDGTPQSVFTLTELGAGGIVTQNGASAIQTLETVTDPTVMRKPVIIAHRGDLQTCPDNTVRGFISAAEYGADAVSADIRMTKDGAFVLYFDETTLMLNERLTVSESTLSQLKELTFNDYRAQANDRIATLEELFEAVYHEYPTLVLHLYIHGDAVRSVGSIIELASEYGMADRVATVFTDYTAASSEIPGALGVCSVYSAGPYTWVPSDMGLSVSEMLGNLASGTYYGNLEGMPPRLLTAVHLRGASVFPWSADGEALCDSCFVSGLDGYSTGMPSLTGKYAGSLDASVDENGRLSVVVTFRDGTSLDASAVAELIVLQGDVRLSGGVISGVGTYAVSYTATTQSGMSYRVCSKASGAGAAPETSGDTTVNDDPGTGGNMTVAVITVSAVCVAAGFAILAFMRKRGGERAKTR